MNPSSTTTDSPLSRALYRVTSVIWIGLSIAWLKSDRLIRDGDEEGHVGAAELFLGDLSRGQWLEFLERLWIGPMGEYPQTFAAGVGAWWWAWGGGLPGATGVRAVCLFSLLVAAMATARIARRYIPADKADAGELIAYVSVLLLPLGNGLTRHFMPEGGLMAVVALTLLSAHRLVERPSPGRALELGGLLGVGLLTKQTFPLLVVIPLLWVLRRLGRRASKILLISTVIAALISGPWWFFNATNQMSYGVASLSNRASGGLWSHLLYYPHMLIFLGLGPGLAIATALAAKKLCTQPDRRGWVFGLAWLAGGLLILTLIPKKYPRLAAPLTPAIGIWIAVLWTRTSGRKLALKCLGAASVLSLAWASLSPTPSLQASSVVDLGCPQIWLRPPAQYDLGLAKVQQALAERPAGAVFIDRDYEIPCGVQTTHTWSTHLSPYLRRSGQERDVHTNPAEDHRFIIRFGPEEGNILVWDTPIYLSIRDKLSP